MVNQAPCDSDITVWHQKSMGSHVALPPGATSWCCWVPPRAQLSLVRLHLLLCHLWSVLSGWHWHDWKGEGVHAAQELHSSSAVAAQITLLLSAELMSRVKELPPNIHKAALLLTNQLLCFHFLSAILAVLPYLLPINIPVDWHLMIYRPNA